MQPTIDPIHRIKGVNVLTGLSRSTIYRLIQEGKFPAPIKIGERASGWKQSTIEAWIDNRAQVAAK